MPQLEIASAVSGRAPDIASIYAAHSVKLQRLVRLDVHASDHVIEEACQRAWHQLAANSERVRSETALSWLVRIAVNAALKELSRRRREVSLEELIETGHEVRVSRAGSEPGARAEARLELGRVSTLPGRQQRMLWLLALGYSHAEIAASEQCTLRTVERQLMRAKRRLRPPSEVQ